MILSITRLSTTKLGIKTFSTTTLNVMALFITTQSIMAYRIMSLSIITRSATMHTHQNIIFIVFPLMQYVVILNVVMISVVS